MKTVYEAANLIDAHLVKHALEAEGIPVYVRGEALTGGMGELGVFGLLGVMVPEGAEREARAVITALHLGDAPLDTLDEEAQPGAQPA